MDIKELKSFTLADAVKFHDKLNPKLWFGEKLLPTAKKQLMTIAQDFVAFMGISNLDIEDITISGSNAAYSYTPHSDIDLHILIDFKKLPDDEVYKELFGAKKTLYNEKHDITVHKVPVELYVQDTNQSHTSLGEYSLLNDKWVKIPKKRRANFDERATKAKYEKLGELVELALKSSDLEKVTDVLEIIGRYRKAGLAKAGEFGPENIAYKAIRAQGLIQKLYDKKGDLHSKSISTENMYEQLDRDHYLARLAQAASKQRGEPEIAMVQAQRALGGGVLSFVLEHAGDIYNRMHNTGYGELDHYNSIEERRYVVLDKIEKTLRTLARKYGFEREHKENLEANARFAAEHGEKSTEDYYRDVDTALKKYALAHAKLPVYNRPQKLAREASIALGDGNFNRAVVYLTSLKNMAENEKLWHEEINKFSETTTEDWHPNAKPPGPEFRPTMPKGTVRVDVSDVYDWYKLGQHISNLKGLGKHDFGKGPPSTILSFGDEDTEHKYIQDLEKTGLTTTDIDPPGGKKRQKTDPTYNVKEGGAETSWSHGTEKITLQDILELTKHIKQINLSINDNLKSKLIHWDGNPEEIERINQVTVSNQFPILVMLDGQGQIDWILDGNHRLHKAIQSQAKTIPAKLIKPSDLSDKAKKIFHIQEQGLVEASGYSPKGKKTVAVKFKITKGKNKFSTSLSVNNKPAGIYQYNAETGRSLAEIYPEFRGQGLGKLLVLHAIYTAAKLGLDFQEDESRTAAYDQVLDSLSNRGYVVGDEGYWYVTDSGEKYLKRTLKESSGYIPSEAERNDLRFKTALTVDVKPDTMQKDAAKLGNKISRAGIPPLLR